MTLEQAFDRLKEKLGTDRKCAEYLGISETYFNAMRRGRRKVSERNELWFITKAEQLDKHE